MFSKFGQLTSSKYNLPMVDDPVLKFLGKLGCADDELGQRRLAASLGKEIQLPIIWVCPLGLRVLRLIKTLHYL